MTASTSINLNTSLSSLALLSLRMNEGNDYLDYLHGFVIGALHEIKSPSFDAATIQGIIQSKFGLKFPVATIAIYLKRLQGPKIIEPTQDGHQFQLLNLPTTSINEDYEAAKGRITEALVKLKDFAHTRYGLNWSIDRSTAALTEFIREYSIDFVRHAEFRSPLPDPGDDSTSDRFIVASFIGDCAVTSYEIFGSIKTLVESHILANALLCPDLKDKGSGYKNVVFVLDTRLLLRAFDLEAPIDTENTRSLLESIQRLKGVLAVFPETKEEIRTVLNGIVRGYKQGNARGPVVEELRKRGRGIADVILVEGKLEESLKTLGVSTLQSPEYDEASYRFQIDEAALRAELEEELGYMLGRAADHDVRVVRSIFALRRGRRVSRLEDAGYVFVTTNSTLSRAAFHQQKEEQDGWVFSAVVTDFHLSHLTWLKSPAEAGDLSRTELLSSCHAAMRPPQPVWRQYVVEVDRLRSEGRFTEQDHEVLRLSLKAPEELMEVTRGEVEGITENNLRAILMRLERTYAAEKEEKLKQERLAHESTMTTLIEREQALTDIRKEKADAEERERALKAEKAKAEQELDKLKTFEEQAQERDARRAARVNTIAERIARIAFILSGFGFAVIGLLALFSNLSVWLGAPAAVVGFFNLWSGFSGNTVEQSVKRWVAKWLSEFMS